MRTMSPAQAQVWASKFRVCLRPWIKDSTGAWTDLTTLDGRNWTRGFAYDGDIDSQVMGGTLTLQRDIHYLNLAPTMTGAKYNLLTGSYAPLIDTGREIKIEVAIVPIGVEPASGDWMNVFWGRTDDIDWGQVPFSISCRDMGSDLQESAFIETEREYGAADGSIKMEHVMQSILTDNGTGVTLYTPVASGMAIWPYLQQEEHCMNALQTLAIQRGWDIRYKWDSGTSAWRLTFYGPDRAKAIPDYTFGPSQYYDIRSLAISRIDLRNAIKIGYLDPADSQYKYVTRTDAPSIAKYGRKFMQIIESSSSQIDTQAEAETMADACLADLKDPKAILEAELPYFPWVEWGDLYRFSANGVHFDSNQDLAVVSFRHDLSNPAKPRTMLTLRGTPAGAYRRWFDTQVWQTGGGDLIASPAPTNVVATSIPGGIAVDMDISVDIGWNLTKVYIFDSAEFVPSDASNLADYGRKIHFEITTSKTIGALIPGVTYYVQVKFVDIDGNVSDASAEVSAEAGTVSGETITDSSIPGRVLAVPIQTLFRGLGGDCVLPDEDGAYGLQILGAEDREYTLEPSDDKSVYSGGPISDNDLWTMDLAEDAQSFLKWDLSSVIGNIAEAYVRLYCSYDTSGNTIGIRRVTGADWDENTLTWGTRPAVDASGFTAAQPLGLGNYYIEHATLLDWVQQWKAETMNNYGIRLHDATINKQTRFWSKEYTDSTKHPYLYIHTTGVAADRYVRVSTGFFMLDGRPYEVTVEPVPVECPAGVTRWVALVMDPNDETVSLLLQEDGTAPEGGIILGKVTADADQLTVIDMSAGTGRKDGALGFPGFGVTEYEVNTTPPGGHIWISDWRIVTKNVAYAFDHNLNSLDLEIYAEFKDTSEGMPRIATSAHRADGGVRRGITVKKINANQITVYTGSGHVQYDVKPDGADVFTDGYIRLIVKRIR